MKRVTGISGIFFKAKDPPALLGWYQRHLGVDVQEVGGFAIFGDASATSSAGHILWGIAPAESEHFAPSSAPFTVGYRVEDLHGLVKALKEEGCEVHGSIDETEYGSFASVIDPEGNKVGLWQPPPVRVADPDAIAPSERHRRAREAARAGDYAFALSEYIWYHDHALETEPSQAGVRLSYALNDWMTLGASYPPALQALEEMLVRKATTLREGGGDWQLFDDVGSIAEYLHRGRDTYELFLLLDKQRPAFAASCADVAMPAIIACEDFALARRYLGDASERVKTASLALRMSQRVMTAGPPAHADAMRDAVVTNYVARIRMTLQILEATGETAEASRVRKLAVSAVADSLFRSDVERALLGAPTA